MALVTSTAMSSAVRFVSRIQALLWSIVGLFRGLWSREHSRGRLPAHTGARLPEELEARLEELGHVDGVVRDVVDGGVRDYTALRDVLSGPGAGDDVVADVEILAAAEESVAEILDRAQRIWKVSQIARDRPHDRTGREAAGEALLQLKDRGRALHDVASAALSWAASRSTSDRERLLALCNRLHV